MAGFVERMHMWITADGSQAVEESVRVARAVLQTNEQMAQRLKAVAAELSNAAISMPLSQGMKFEGTASAITAAMTSGRTAGSVSKAFTELNKGMPAGTTLDPRPIQQANAALLQLDSLLTKGAQSVGQLVSVSSGLQAAAANMRALTDAATQNGAVSGIAAEILTSYTATLEQLAATTTQTTQSTKEFAATQQALGKVARETTGTVNLFGNTMSRGMSNALKDVAGFGQGLLVAQGAAKAMEGSITQLAFSLVFLQFNFTPASIAMTLLGIATSVTLGKIEELIARNKAIKEVSSSLVQGLSGSGLSLQKQGEALKVVTNYMAEYRNKLTTVKGIKPEEAFKELTTAAEILVQSGITPTNELLDLLVVRSRATGKSIQDVAKSFVSASGASSGLTLDFKEQSGAITDLLGSSGDYIKDLRTAAEIYPELASKTTAQARAEALRLGVIKVLGEKISASRIAQDAWAESTARAKERFDQSMVGVVDGSHTIDILSERYKSMDVVILAASETLSGPALTAFNNLTKGNLAADEAAKLTLITLDAISDLSLEGLIKQFEAFKAANPNLKDQELLEAFTASIIAMGEKGEKSANKVTTALGKTQEASDALAKSHPIITPEAKTEEATGILGKLFKYMGDNSAPSMSIGMVLTGWLEEDGVKSVIDTVATTAKKGFEVTTDFLHDGWDNVGTGVKTVGIKLAEWGTNGFKNTTKFLHEGWDTATTGVKAVGAKLDEWKTAGWSTITTFGKSGWDTPETGVKAVAATIIGWKDAGWSASVALGKTGWDTAETGLKAVAATIVGWKTAGWSAAVALSHTGWGEATTGLKAIMTTIESWKDKALSATISFTASTTSNIFTTVQGWVADGITIVTKMKEHVTSSMFSTLLSWWNNGMAFTSKMTNTAKDVFEVLKGWKDDGLELVLKLGGDIADFIKGTVNSVINKLNTILKAALPPLNLIQLPTLAKGGIVTQPTLALIGEAGPEAVVPLTGPNAAASGGSTTITIDLRGAYIMSEQVPQDLVDKISHELYIRMGNARHMFTR